MAGKARGLVNDNAFLLRGAQFPRSIQEEKEDW